MCEGSLRGLYVFCPECFHGGHPEHLKSWFSSNADCPVGCGCKCSEIGLDELNLNEYNNQRIGAEKLKFLAKCTSKEGIVYDLKEDSSDDSIFDCLDHIQGESDSTSTTSTRTSSSDSDRAQIDEKNPFDQEDDYGYYVMGRSLGRSFDNS